MDEYESLSHSAWDCKYHLVIIPKYRRKALYVRLRNHLARFSGDWRRETESD